MSLWKGTGAKLIFIWIKETGQFFYAKCCCKADECCSHVIAGMYQLVDYKISDLKSVPDDKTCTDVLQQWHAPGQLSNTEPILFENPTFEKADTETGKNKLRKRQIHIGKGTSLLHLHLPKMVLLQNNYKIWRWSKSHEICMATLIKGKTIVLFPIFTIFHLKQSLGKRLRKKRN